MHREEPAPSTARASRPALAASAIAALTAALTLAGWVVPAIETGAFGFAMLPLNALAILFLAAALASAAARPATPALRAIAPAATLAAAAIAAAVLAVHLVGAEAVLDRLLLPAAGAGAAARATGRPAAIAATAVLALALALVLARRGTLHGLLHTLAGAVAALALQSLAASAYGLGPLLALPAPRSVTAAAALALLALAAGVELVRPGRGLHALWNAPGVAGFAARNLLPAAVLVPIVAGWLALLGQRAGLYGPAFALSLAVVASIVMLWVVIARGARIIARLDRRRTRVEHERTRLLGLERRSRLAAERSAREEQALRRVAQSLAAAFDLGSILHAIAESATDIADADGVYVERRRGRDEVEVAAVAGWGAPPLDTRVPYPGSLTEEMVRSRHTEILEDIALENRRISRHLVRSCGHCRALVAPLFSEDEPVGALVLLRRTERHAFTPHESDRVGLLAGLATLSLQRGLLAQETEERRRQAEASEQRFRSLFELNPDSVFSFDARGTFTSANPATERITGHPVRETIGQHFTYLVLREHLGRVRHAFDRALTGEPQRLELEIQPRDGGRRQLQANLVPMIQAGRVVGVFGIAEDVTEQRRAERQLRAARAEAERRAREDAALRRATETIAVAFTDEEVMRAIAEGALIATGADGAFVERLVAGGKDLVVAAVAGEWTPEPGASSPLAGALGEEILLRGSPLAVPRVRDSGRPLAPGFAERCGDCGLLGVPLVNAGQAVGVLLLVRAPDRPCFTPEQTARATTFSRLASLAFRKLHLLDDSERRREELERVLESRSRLVRGFSHDVKNPVGAADGQAALLEEAALGPLDPPQLDGVRRIRRSLRSAIALIDDLVSLARTEAEEIEIERKPTDLRIVAHEMAEEHRAQAEAAGLHLEIGRPPALHPVAVDPGRVRQVLGNLISNAVKYTPRGGRVTVGVSLREEGPGGDRGEWIAVHVSDTGAGIPEDRQEEIFREFIRLEPGAGGAGLGLSISRRIARIMGGDVTVDSAPGRGSTFTLWLPAAATEPAQQPPGEPARPAAAESPPEPGEAERAETQREPANAADLCELLVRSVSDYAIYALDTGGRILTWNDGAERLTGYAADDIIGQHVAVFHTPEQVERGDAECALRLAAESGHFADEGWRVRKDRSRFWAGTAITALRDSAGRLIGYSKVVSDLTDRKREEDTQRFLAEASRVLGSSLDYRATLRRVTRLAVPRIADLAVVYTFEDHQPTRLEVVHADPQTLRIMRDIERRYAGMEARRLRPLLELAQEGRPALIAEVSDAMLRAAALDAEHHALLRRIGIRSAMVLPLDARGRVLGVIVMVALAARAAYTDSDLALADDLARRAALAVDNARLYEAALVANRARSDFLAVMSHELRTPLNAIVGYADLLLLGVPEPPPPPAREQLERIIASAQHLRELIEDILSFSRIEAGRQEVSLARTDLRETLDRAARTVAPLASEKHLRFRFEPPAEPLIVETDADKVRQLLLDLLSNAVKFTDAGEIQLSARREDDAVLIDVRDTGIGIAPENIERVFDPFWQVEQTATRRAPGTGLGLTLARRLARLLGGELTATSEPDRGSTFTVRLPARAAATAAPPRRPRSRRPAPGSHAEGAEDAEN